MAKSKEPTNPFYVVLVVAGVVFAITACAYGIMAYRAVTPGPADVISASGHEMMAFLNHYGMHVMAGELFVLAGATFAAMATDHYWMSRRQASGRRDDEGTARD